MPHTFDLVITGRCAKVLIEDPRTPSGYRLVKDQSPMRIQYISPQHSLHHRELRDLEKVSHDSPGAQVTLPDGRQMPLSQWLQNPVPDAPEPDPATVDGPPVPTADAPETPAATPAAPVIAS